MLVQVIDCYPRPTEPESCEALNTLDFSDKNSQASFLPNYLSGWVLESFKVYGVQNIWNFDYLISIHMGKS